MNEKNPNTTPVYGNWPESELRRLVADKMRDFDVTAPYPMERAQRIAMQIAKLTGASYNWLQQRVEEHLPPVRFS